MPISKDQQAKFLKFNHYSSKLKAQFIDNRNALPETIEVFIAKEKNLELKNLDFNKYQEKIVLTKGEELNYNECRYYSTGIVDYLNKGYNVLIFKQEKTSTIKCSYMVVLVNERIRSLKTNNQLNDNC